MEQNHERLLKRGGGVSSAEAELAGYSSHHVPKFGSVELMLRGQSCQFFDCYRWNSVGGFEVFVLFERLVIHKDLIYLPASERAI